MLGPASLVPTLMESFEIGKTTAGYTISASYVGWLVFQLPGGYLIDRYDNRPLVLVAIMLFVAASIAGTGVESYRSFLVSRGLGGAAGGILFIANVNIVGSVFPENLRGFATGTVLGSSLVGMALGQSTSQIIATFSHWSFAFVAYSGIAIIGYLFLRWGLASAVRSRGSTSLRGTLHVMTHPYVLALAVAGFCVNGVFIFLNSWIPTYATEMLDVSLVLSGVIGAMIPISGAIARPSGGFLSDFINSRRLVSIWTLAFVLPILLVIPFISSWLLFSAILIFLGLALEAGFGVYYIHIQELVNPEMKGTSLALLNLFVIFGGLVAPALGGEIIERYSWTVAYQAFCLIGAIGLGALFVVPETFSSDTE